MRVVGPPTPQTVRQMNNAGDSFSYSSAAMNHNTPKKIKRAIREYASQLYEADLRKELEALSTKFAEWQAGTIDSFDLQDAIHQFHHGAARELYKQYNQSDLDFIVAQAIVAGPINREQVPAEVLAHLGNVIAFFENQQQAEAGGPTTQ